MFSPFTVVVSIGALVVGIIGSIGTSVLRNYRQQQTGEVLYAYIEELPTLTPTPTPTSTPTLTPTVTPIPKATATPTITPIPTATQPQFSPQQIDEFFKKFSGEYSVEESLLRKIAVCESGYNQFSKSKYYVGMFQFSESSWRSSRNAMGLDPDPSLRLHAEEAIRTAAWKISHQGTGAWPNCGK